MNIPYIRAPHAEGATAPQQSNSAPNAALLIDFDNVTMGMRSDLSKELKNLLKSDVIRGKVTVQRAYADWRRYPQYIVPLSEASVDLIFAPAYGSSKKNATDIRMAIDGMELVFTRPEIGTYILLTGDSDFSSLVLKLKEYGKYVIGVGIQESSSDILVQNCDEYYSYTTLSGLRKAGSGEQKSQQDPWSLVERAVDQMTKRRDVMRSDRLKQVMLDLDSTFDEKAIGFSKFSRFLTEAAQKGLLELKKLDNGQYEVAAGRSSGRTAASSDGGDSRGSSRRDRDEGRAGGRNGRGRSRDRDEAPSVTAAAPEAPAPEERSARKDASSEIDPRTQADTRSAPDEEGAGTDPVRLREGYDLLVRAIADLADGEGGAVRDSDVKRRMLAMEDGFDEAALGFSKFSRFLRQAHDHEVVDLSRDENGIYELRVKDGVAAFDRIVGRGRAAAAESQKAESGRSDAERSDTRKPEPKKDRATTDTAPSTPASTEGRRLRPRLSARRRGGAEDEPPPLLEGQTVSTPSLAGRTSEEKAEEAAPPKETGREKQDSPRKGRGKKGAEVAEAEPRGQASRDSAGKPPAKKSAPTTGGSDLDQLGLPNGPDAMAQYLTNSYKGVGKKTAETLIQAHGEALFQVLDTDPDAIRALLPSSRAEGLLEQWIDDVARRRAELHGPAGRPSRESGKEKPASRSGGGRRKGGPGGGRRRGGSSGRSRS